MRLAPVAVLAFAACSPVENDACDPSFTDLLGDDLDQDCDGLDGVDRDGDGVASVASGGLDCDDDDDGVLPGVDDACNGVDDDCNGIPDDGPGSAIWFRDADGDGVGLAADTLRACEAPAGFAAEGGDCDDTRAVVLGPSEWHPDQDGDGFGGADVTAEGCLGPPGSVADATDCDDRRPDVTGPTLGFEDADGDGFGAEGGAGAPSCDLPAGQVPRAGDCDDEDAAVHPAALEVCGPADDDCDGLVDDADASVSAPAWYADLDGDGAGDPSAPFRACLAPAGHVADSGDCDDARDDVFPGASEVPEDGVDQDCDGSDPPDFDGDGFGLPDDCDDGDPNLSPTAADLGGDFVDQNCDGVDGTDYDRDGFASLLSGGEDCDDHEARTFPGAREILGDGVANPCSGGGGVDRLAAIDASVNSNSSPTQAVGGDFDGDGLLEIVDRNGNVWEDSRDGFEVAASRLVHNGLALALPDLDGDGDAEAAMCDYADSYAWLGEVDGNHDLQFRGFPSFVDLDGDGILDLVTAEDRYVRVNLGPLGTGTFQTGAAPVTEVELTRTDGFPSAGMADFDGDGELDLLVRSYLEGTLVAYGPLAPNYTRTADFDVVIPITATSDPVALDVDGDGLPEVVLGIGGNRLLAFRADVPGRYTENDALVDFRDNRNTWSSALRVALWDANHDGRADLWATGPSGAFLLDGALLETEPSSVDDIALGSVSAQSLAEVPDITGDGQPELVWTSSSTISVVYSPW